MKYLCNIKSAGTDFKAQYQHYKREKKRSYISLYDLVLFISVCTIISNEDNGTK